MITTLYNVKITKMGDFIKIEKEDSTYLKNWFLIEKGEGEDKETLLISYFKNISTNVEGGKRAEFLKLGTAIEEAYSTGKMVTVSVSINQSKVISNSAILKDDNTKQFEYTSTSFYVLSLKEAVQVNKKQNRISLSSLI